MQFLNDDQSLEECAACRTQRRAGSDDGRVQGGGGGGVSIENEVLDEATMTVTGDSASANTRTRWMHSIEQIAQDVHAPCLRSAPHFLCACTRPRTAQALWLVRRWEA